MKKILNLTLSGVLLIAAGILMLVAEKIGLQISKMVIPLLFALSGVLCLLFYSANKKYKIPSQFQFLQGLGLIIYAIVIFLFPKSLLQFLMVTSYFIMLFGITEIGFSFSVLNSSSKTFKEPLILVLTSFKNEYKGIQIAGFLTIIIGVSNMIFVSKVKKIDIQDL